MYIAFLFIQLRMTNVNLKFSASLAASDPASNPVLIVGQLKNLTRLTYEDVRIKLEKRVSEDVSIPQS